MMKKTKLLTILVGLAMGGAEHMAFELIRSIDKNEYEPIVLCTGLKLNTPLEKDMEEICQVEYYGHTGKITPLTLLGVMRKISAIKPDIVHAHMGAVAYAVPWTGLHNKPLVITVHTKPEKAFSKANEYMVRRALNRHNTMLVAVSEDNYYKVRDYFGLLNNICYINNGINIDRFKSVDHDGFVFINVARQDENKNQAIIIRAFSRLNKENPKSKLFLIGDGPCHEELIKITEELYLTSKIVIPGQIAAPEEYYAQADVYVQSSHREAMPLSVLEAMATGLPIISTDVGGLTDVIKDNGYIVPDNDEEELYNAMHRISKLDHESFAVMSRSSKDISKMYSSDKMAEEYSTLYKTLTR